MGWCEKKDEEDDEVQEENKVMISPESPYPSYYHNSESTEQDQDYPHATKTAERNRVGSELDHPDQGIDSRSAQLSREYL